MNFQYLGLPETTLILSETPEQSYIIYSTVLPPVDIAQYFLSPYYKKAQTKQKSHTKSLTLQEEKETHCNKSPIGQGEEANDTAFFHLNYVLETKTNRGASPEFISHKDDSTLQQQRGKDSYHLPYTEATKQAVKVHVLQPGVGGPPQLDDLNEMKFKPSQIFFQYLKLICANGHN